MAALMDEAQTRAPLDGSDRPAPSGMDRNIDFVPSVASVKTSEIIRQAIKGRRIRMLGVAADPESGMQMIDRFRTGLNADCVIDFMCPDSIHCVFREMHEEIRLMFFDVQLVQRFGLHQVLELRRQFRGPEWILVSGAETPPPTDLIVRCQARGMVDWQQDPATLLRAIEAVLAGELWFSRSTMQAIYATLLAARNPALAMDDPAVMGTAVDDDSKRQILTPREVEALALMRQGLTNKQIALRLDISVNTVKKHLAHAFEKAGLHSRRQTFG